MEAGAEDVWNVTAELLLNIWSKYGITAHLIRNTSKANRKTGGGVPMSTRSLRHGHVAGGNAPELRHSNALSSPSTQPETRDPQDLKPSADPPVTVVRTTVNLHPDAVAALREMALDRGTTIAEVIRRAIWMEKYVHDALKDGSKILVQDADRTLKELVIR